MARRTFIVSAVAIAAAAVMVYALVGRSKPTAATPAQNATRPVAATGIPDPRDPRASRSPSDPAAGAAATGSATAPTLTPHLPPGLSGHVAALEGPQAPTTAPAGPAATTVRASNAKYDPHQFDEVRAAALATLATSPHDVPALRAMAITSCAMRDPEGARQYGGKLTGTDKADVQAACKAAGLTLDERPNDFDSRTMKPTSDGLPHPPK